ncbi:MAG: hypothetical protein Q8P44_03000 [Dehalococcoidia bacterium]|nr:hypothetical protein [Dehalococcoidia bacterium]
MAEEPRTIALEFRKKGQHQGAMAPPGVLLNGASGRRFFEGATGAGPAPNCKAQFQVKLKSIVMAIVYSLLSFSLTGEVSHKWPYNLCHSGLDPESSLLLWIPAFAGMTPVSTSNCTEILELLH